VKQSETTHSLVSNDFKLSAHRSAVKIVICFQGKSSQARFWCREFANMKVICSGMPKTGTKSLSAALRVLGYTVYDLEEQFWYRGAELTKLMMEGCSIKEIREIYEDADAVTDIPSNAFWEEILQAFPDSKVHLVFIFKATIDTKSFGNCCFQGQFYFMFLKTLFSVVS